MTTWVTMDGSGVAVLEEDECMLLLGDPVPQWIRMPQESPIDPGRELRVLGSKESTCPRCRSRVVRHLLLEDRFGVAECNGGCGYVVYRFLESTP